MVNHFHWENISFEMISCIFSVILSVDRFGDASVVCRPRAGADPGFLKGGSILGLQAKKRGGGPRGGPTLGPMLKSLHRGPKGGGGGPDPLAPPPLDPPL